MINVVVDARDPVTGLERHLSFTTPEPIAAVDAWLHQLSRAPSTQTLNEEQAVEGQG